MIEHDMTLDAEIMRFDLSIKAMEQSVLDSFLDMEKGYGRRKIAIQKNTGIPMDILTVILKRLKYAGKIQIIMLFSEYDGMVSGCGYCLSGNDD